MAWQEIEGHDEVVEAFRQAIQRGRLAHAYLFVGEPGIGKRLFALKLAQTLLCESRRSDDFEPCGHCDACVQVRAGTHPDLITLGRGADEHDLPIDVIRGAIHDLGFKPDRGRCKVAIVDDADDMNQYAANCFLKCLEEPPPRSLLILIGTSAERQLPTIRSRCQVVRFRPLPTALVAQILERSGVAGERAEAERLAALGGGSVERARRLADADLWSFRVRLWKSLASRRMDSAALADEMNKLIESAGKESAEKRGRARLLVGMATEFLHGALRMSAGASPGLLAGSETEISQLAEHHSTEDIARLIDRSLDADYQIDRKGSVPLVIEAWADAMAGA